MVHILPDDEPWSHISADAEPLALTDRVIEHAAVCAYFTAIRDIDDITILCRKVIMQKGAKIALPDETDAGRILLLGDRIQMQLVSDISYLWFGLISSAMNRGRVLIL